MPAEWQVYKISSSPFFIFLWDACEKREAVFERILAAKGNSELLHWAQNYIRRVVPPAGNE